MQDIFTLEQLDAPGNEHILPAVLGGKLSSSDLIQQTTNTALGSSIEPPLVDSLRMFLNALGMTSRRGKTVGYNLHPESESRYMLTTGLKPQLPRASMTERIVDGKRLLTITARSTEEARRLIAAAKNKYPSLDVAGADAVSKQHFPKDPFHQTLAIGGPLFLRALAKTAFEGFALAAGNAAACASEFDEFRSWILKGVENHQQFRAELISENANYSNHDYRESIWSGLPQLDNAPFQHRVFVVGGSAVGGAYGLVELFGALRFSSVLTISPNVPACRFGYLVDPVTGREDRSLTFQCSSAAQLVAEHEIDLVDSRAAVENLLRRIQEKHRNDMISGVIEKAMDRALPAEGEIIQPSHIAALSASVAEEFTRYYLRIDSEVPIDLEEFLSENDEPTGE